MINFINQPRAMKRVVIHTAASSKELFTDVAQFNIWFACDKALRFVDVDYRFDQNCPAQSHSRFSKEVVTLNLAGFL